MDIVVAVGNVQLVGVMGEMQWLVLVILGLTTSSMYILSVYLKELLQGERKGLQHFSVKSLGFLGASFQIKALLIMKTPLSHFLLY